VGGAEGKGEVRLSLLRIGAQQQRLERGAEPWVHAKREGREDVGVFLRLRSLIDCQAGPATRVGFYMANFSHLSGPAGEQQTLAAAREASSTSRMQS
jgi:hypothetical protein